MSSESAASVSWVKQVQTIRRVLMGQWANNDARLKALKALDELEKELVERG